jgi:hypothetical protein
MLVCSCLPNSTSSVSDQLLVRSVYISFVCAVCLCYNSANVATCATDAIAVSADITTGATTAVQAAVPVAAAARAVQAQAETAMQTVSDSSLFCFQLLKMLQLLAVLALRCVQRYSVDSSAAVVICAERRYCR